MKKLLLIGLVAVLTLTLGTAAVMADKPQAEDGSYNGNGAPSGAHYNLNIIGVPKEKTADMSNSQGHRIFVKLEGKTKIDLQEGDFQVIDPNGTDGKAAFQLPNPDPDGDGVTVYSVFVRALGKPGGSATMTSVLVDELGQEWWSTENKVVVRNKGGSKFENVSRELLYICVDWDQDGTCDEKLPLFGNEAYSYFWDYDNSGLKLAQLRFYPDVSTDTN